MCIYKYRIFSLINRNRKQSEDGACLKQCYLPYFEIISYDFCPSIPCLDIGIFSTIICFIPAQDWTDSGWVLTYNKAWNPEISVLRLLHYLSSGSLGGERCKRKFYKALIITYFGEGKPCLGQASHTAGSLLRNYLFWAGTLSYFWPLGWVQLGTL